MKKKKKGINLYVHKNVNKTIDSAFIDYVSWVNKNFHIPTKVSLYLKPEKQLKTKKGEYVSATFFASNKKSDAPYIKIATGDSISDSTCISEYINSAGHELIHYFQWIDNIDLYDVDEIHFDEEDAEQGAEEITQEYYDDVLDRIILKSKKPKLNDIYWLKRIFNYSPIHIKVEIVKVLDKYTAYQITKEFLIELSNSSYKKINNLAKHILSKHWPVEDATQLTLLND
ncbi:hypothetical protein [Risungbinella massiliensis]|uniref:hypothetical protein n=1 Tax=Risungbinella massiliensis TaxID=1329796 RepID=UPI0005CB842B|nr:hypothetical protein [Risungbinella massiliensis]